VLRHVRSVRRFWKTLRLVPGGATSRYDWTQLLQGEWPLVEPLLRSTGTVASRIICPSPGGDGCPRRVLHDESGTRAVCGDPLFGCDEVDLALEDIIVLAVDVSTLADSLCRSLDCAPDLRALPFIDGTWCIGWYEPLAGKRFPLSLTFPTTGEEAHLAAVRLVGHLGQRFILFVPAREPIEPETIEYLRGQRVCILFLEDMLTVAAAGTWQLQRTAEEILGDFNRSMLDDPRLSVPTHEFATPAGTRWQDVTIRFLTQHQVQVQIGRSSGVFDFTQMGMADGRTNPVVPDSRWTLLAAFAEGRGVVRWRTTSENRRRQKQKDGLGKVLRTFFGIGENPFEPLEDRRGWRARFRVVPEV
jgi:hypothetical protein